MKSENPFEMWEVWVVTIILTIILILFETTLNNFSFVDTISKITAESYWLFLIIWIFTALSICIVGFLLGWGIHSIFRATGGKK